MRQGTARGRHGTKKCTEHDKVDDRIVISYPLAGFSYLSLGHLELKFSWIQFWRLKFSSVLFDT